jgi:hypothetical protein
MMERSAARLGTVGASGNSAIRPGWRLKNRTRSDKRDHPHEPALEEPSALQHEGPSNKAGACQGWSEAESAQPTRRRSALDKTTPTIAILAESGDSRARHSAELHELPRTSDEVGRRACNGPLGYARATAYVGAHRVSGERSLGLATELPQSLNYRYDRRELAFRRDRTPCRGMDRRANKDSSAHDAKWSFALQRVQFFKHGGHNGQPHRGTR